MFFTSNGRNIQPGNSFQDIQNTFTESQPTGHSVSLLLHFVQMICYDKPFA